MNKDITVTLTQEEANALYTAMVGKLDDFDEQIKKQVKKGIQDVYLNVPSGLKL